MSINKKRTIYILPRYNQIGASSRFRFYQYQKFWEAGGFEIKFQPLLSNTHFGLSKIPSTIIAYLRRILFLVTVKPGSILFIEKELFPYFTDLLILVKLKKLKYILDYDDAIFHSYDFENKGFLRYLFKNKIPNLLKGASHIITGSPYLTSYCLRYTSKVTEIPTSIYFTDYSNRTKANQSEIFTIGWIGSLSTSSHLYKIKDALIEFSKNKDCEIHLIGFDKALLSNFNSKFKAVEWSSATEVENISKFNVGIMPLSETLFEKGKCGFKLIQYMACGIPTISTPLEANVKINRDNNNLFATSHSQWVDALNQVYQKQQYYKEIGALNTKIISKYYSIEANHTLYLTIFDLL
jgi:glycosyltransferase involved in cell wall biosynthesis